MRGRSRTVKAVHWSELPGALNTWLAGRLKGWNATSRQTKAFHMMRFFMAIMLIGGGLIIHQSQTTSGILAVMERGLPLITVREFGLLTVTSGILLMFTRRPTVGRFALHVLPIILYCAYGLQGAFLGLYGWSGVFMLAMMLTLICIMIWGYSYDGH